MSDPGGTATAQSETSLPGTPRKRIVLGALLAVLMVGGGWGFHVWTHPTLLSENAMGLGSGSTAPTPLAEATFHVGVAGTPWRPPYGAPASEETLTLKSARAYFAENGAGMNASFFVCTAAERDSAIGVVGNEDLAGHCSKVRRIKDGTKIRWGSREYIVMTLTATRPGTTRVNRVDIGYARTGAHLFQHGTERLDEGGITVTVTD